MNRFRTRVLITLALVAFSCSWRGPMAADSATTQTKKTIFTYEGEPRAVEVTADRIFVDYQASRCEFDRASGKMLGRKTRADGYAPLPDKTSHSREPRLIGPGVMYGFASDVEKSLQASAEAAQIKFFGRTWRALQPANFLLSRKPSPTTKPWSTWGEIMDELNEKAYVETAGTTGPLRRYTMKDGLASNIVTRFALADGSLWAACADIYDAAKKEWGPGGLCRYDTKTDRWHRVNEIGGWPVRWVSLLQTVGDELWVGFREGSGIDGDSIVYGMGIFPGNYQPATKSIVLARLKAGKWDCFARPPMVDPRHPWAKSDDERTTPSEKLIKLVQRDNAVLVLSNRKIKPSYNWEVQWDGALSWLDTVSGDWRVFRLGEDIIADFVNDMFEKNDEVIALSNRGVLRWSDSDQNWLFLDPQSPLKNPTIGTIAAARDEIWVGYQRQNWNEWGNQGISRFNEKTGEWKWMSPQMLGTSSPVLNIAPLPDGSVWVYFRSMPEMSPMVSPTGYPDGVEKKGGIGRYFNGKWEFPVALDGIPTTTTTQQPMGLNKTRTVTRQLPIMQMAGSGGKLFVVNTEGVYMGPNPWKQICSVSKEATVPQPNHDDMFGESALIIEPGKNGSLLITDMSRRNGVQGPRDIMQAAYRPGDAHMEFKPVHINEEPFYAYRMRVYRGPMQAETARAKWKASHGELVREEKAK